MSRHLVVLFTALTVLTPFIARAQVNDANLSASCSPGEVSLTAEFDITQPLPAEWTGWIIERETNGVCEPSVRIGEPIAFPAGAQSFPVSDASAVSGRSYRYRIYATDAEGNRLSLSGGSFSPGYLQTAFTSCGSAPVAQGKLVDLGWTSGIEICDPDQCWFWTSFVSFLPPELESLVGSSTMVRLYGQLNDEFEGTYVAQVSGWEIVGDCEAVDTTSASWGAPCWK